MNIQELRALLGCTKKEFATRYNIPFRTIQNWELGERTPPEYVLQLLEEKVKKDAKDKQIVLVRFHFPKMIDLPSKGKFLDNFSWLKELQNYLGKDFIFALDEALMCDEYYLGRQEEALIWGYGKKETQKFKKVSLLGESVDGLYVKERKGILYTNFNKTLIDSLDNEAILDMQGITEALSRYYYTHNETFSGLYIDPEHLEGFKKLSTEAIEYYDS